MSENWRARVGLETPSPGPQLIRGATGMGAFGMALIVAGLVVGVSSKVGVALVAVGGIFVALFVVGGGIAVLVQGKVQRRIDELLAGAVLAHWRYSRADVLAWEARVAAQPRRRILATLSRTRPRHMHLPRADGAAEVYIGRDGVYQPPPKARYAALSGFLGISLTDVTLMDQDPAWLAFTVRIVSEGGDYDQQVDVMVPSDAVPEAHAVVAALGS
ncbi:MAG TPA: hypothetical protein VGU73_06530 [Acidimicrobiia bacterium]|nr:hypothetical protein [Acidimicrobiia bacterium]